MIPRRAKKPVWDCREPSRMDIKSVNVTYQKGEACGFLSNPKRLDRAELGEEVFKVSLRYVLGKTAYIDSASIC